MSLWRDPRLWEQCESGFRGLWSRNNVLDFLLSILWFHEWRCFWIFLLYRVGIHRRRAQDDLDEANCLPTRRRGEVYKVQGFRF